MPTMTPQFWKRKIITEFRQHERELLRPQLDGMWAANSEYTPIKLQYWHTRLAAINFLIAHLDDLIADKERTPTEAEIKRLQERRLALMALRSDNQNSIGAVLVEQSADAQGAVFGALTVTNIVPPQDYGPDPSDVRYRGFSQRRWL